MTKKAEIIIALGSNTNQQNNIDQACAELKAMLPGLRFTQTLWTDPINMISPKFLNCIAWGTTTLPQDQLQALLKATERHHGDLFELRVQNIVKLDLDLLIYGTERLHLNDWKRPYICKLLKNIYEENHICNHITDLSAES